MCNQLVTARAAPNVLASPRQHQRNSQHINDFVWQVKAPQLTHHEIKCFPRAALNSVRHAGGGKTKIARQKARPGNVH